ncbi:MAG: chemotaxis protein CheA [Bdellovibrio sp.]
MEEFEKEIKICFLDEASQSIADVEQCFLELENDPQDKENLNKIFRLAHNLKGSSKAVGFDQFGTFTHEFETFILKIKNGELPASKEVISLLLKANDFVSYMIDGLKAQLDAAFDIDALINEMKGFSTANSTQAEATISIEQVEEVLAENPVEESPIAGITESITSPSVEISFAQETVTNSVELVAPNSSSPTLTKSNHKETQEASKKGDQNNSKTVTDESIRVSLSKVEMLLNFVGEMVILQSVLREQLTEESSMLMRKTVHQMGKAGKEIQDLSMSLRMVPVKSTFQKMQRIVRDTANLLSKEVKIQLVGEDTELDKTVLERISDPLVHLVRNSVDHGIESSDVRVNRGKPASGTVILKSYHQSGKLVIEVTDDGGGLDADRLKKKAIEKKILKPDANLSEAEAFQLIFAPGFSTKEQVSEVSGRGVGMDVVRTNITELGGEIQIFSELGKGTTFKIVLPLTLAIIEAMVVRCGKEKFVMPLNHVFETLQPKPAMLQSSHNMGDILLLRGENLPLYRLADFFNLKSDTNATNMIAMVIRSGNKPFALLVDDILGQYQVVVKQMGRELQNYVGVSGSTILGDGRPCLILEPADLLKRKMTVHTPLYVGGVAA